MARFANSAASYVRMSQEYANAARALNYGEAYGDYPPYAPLYQMVGISLELVMKADRLLNGEEMDDLKSYGHNLVTLYGAMSNGKRKDSEKMVGRVFIKKLREFRHNHEASFGEYADAVRDIAEIADNEVIGKSVPSASTAIAQLNAAYFNVDSLRYFLESTVTRPVLKFPPWSDLNALFLCDLIDALAQNMDQEMQRTVQ